MYKYSKYKKLHLDKGKESFLNYCVYTNYIYVSGNITNTIIITIPSAYLS